MYLVSNASSTTGKEVTRKLCAKGVAVRALLFNPEQKHTLPEEVELALVDKNDRSSLARAVQGVEKLLLLSPPSLGQVRLQGAIIAAAQVAGVKHVVKISAFGACTDSRIRLARMHAKIESQLESSGMIYTHIRPNLSMQYLLQHAESIRDKRVFFAPINGARISLVDVRDIAEVAVAALMEEGHENRAYEITGPEALSFSDLAGILSKVLGASVRFQQVSPDDARSEMHEQAIPAWLAEDILRIFDVYNSGIGSIISTWSEEITGSRPRSFNQFAKDYSCCFRKAS